MKLVVGLGNPGARYAATRHNIGARIVDRFAIDHGIALAERRFESRFGRGQIALAAVRSPEDPANHPAEHPSEPPAENLDLDVGLLIPETHMNRSGIALSAALRGLPVADIRTDLLVVVDDLDLPFGRIRIRPRGGSAGHRGLEDIADQIGSSDFPRLRFGIGRPESEIPAADWVLRDFSAAEEAALEERIPVAADAVGTILIDGVILAMNRYNRGPDEGE
jgi:PTH1 family peptidyl-tRNA hydrolase